MFYLLLILYFLFFAYLTYRRPEWAVYLTIFALPSYLIRFKILGLSSTVLEVMILALFAVWFIKKVFLDRDFKFFSLADNKGLYYAIGLFLLAATVAMLTAPGILPAVGIWKAYFIEPVLLLIVLLNVIKTKKNLIGVIWALGLSILVPGLIAIYQKFTGSFIPVEFWSTAETRRVTSFYGYPNAIGLYFAPVIIILIAIIAKKTKQLFSNKLKLTPSQKSTSWRKLFLLGVIIVVGLLSVVFAASKGAFLAIEAGLLFYALFWKGYRKYFISLLVVFGLLGFILTPQLFSLTGSKTVSGGGSAEVRLQQWSETINMLKDRPLLGAGLSGYQTRVTPYHQQEHIEIFMYPHQLLFNFWSEIGLLGLIAFIWIVILFYKQGFPCLKSSHYNLAPKTDTLIPIMAAMTTLLAHGLVDVPYFKNDLSVLFWLVIGLLIISNNKLEVYHQG
jgi:O-antigen ligase